MGRTVILDQATIDQYEDRIGYLEGEVDRLEYEREQWRSLVHAVRTMLEEHLGTTIEVPDDIPAYLDEALNY